MNQPVTLYLADDHQIVVDGLKLLIGQEEHIRIVGSANDWDTAYGEIVTRKPDIALLDLRMPPENVKGLELVYKLAKTAPETKVVILSMNENPRNIRDAMNGGAAGYLRKNIGQATLIQCLTAVMQGELYFPTIPKEKDAVKSLFTPRETEILKLVLDDRTTPQIADILSLSPLTVETHRKNIGRKAGTSTSIGLMKFLQEQHIEL